MMKKSNLKGSLPSYWKRCLRISKFSILMLVVGIMQASAGNSIDTKLTTEMLSKLSKIQSTVSGKVIDGSGFGIPGVNVIIKGSGDGTITDLDGNFSLEVPNESSILVFSFVGMKKQEVTVGNQTTINVTMIEDAEGLEEIVVVGYGVMKKKLKTGASLNVKGDELVSRNAANVMDALKGTSPGVSITQNNGQPGSGTKVYIRGIGTTGNAKPLYIVDGISVGDIDYLSPSDIESIDVLKDAASAAIYGSRAANGVILVTTKKGSKGKMNISYESYIGWQNVYKDPDLLGATKYAELMNEASLNNGKNEIDFAKVVPDWDRIESGEWDGTNWFQEIKVPNAVIQNHALNLTGGSERAIYSLGASYLDQQGILGKQANSEYKRLSLRLNTEFILAKKGNLDILKFGENLTFTNKQNPSLRTGNIYYNDVHNALVTSPFIPIYDEDGEYHKAIEWNSMEANPIGLMEYNRKHQENSNNNMIGNVYLEIQPIKNLKIRSAYGANMWFGSSRSWIPAYELGPNDTHIMDEVNQSMNFGYSWTITNTISYTTDILDGHNLSAMIGQETQKSKTDLNIKGINEGSIFQDAEHAYLNNVPISDLALVKMEGKDDYGWGMLSYFGRLSYNYKEKYLLTGVLRADASSNFMEGNRWGYFPSVAAGWVVTNENFMSSVSDWLNFLKVRGSWGQNGNQDILKFQYVSAIDFELADYFFGTDKGNRTLGAYPSLLPNPDVSWETSEQIDVGIDVHFFNSKLQATFDWYQKDTRDWLIKAPSLATDGTEPPFVNGGAVSNKGVEFMVRWNDNIDDFKYGVSFSVSNNKNEVTSIDNDEKIIHGPSNVISQGTGEMFRAEEGFPIGYFWGFETDGIMQNEAEVEQYVTPEGEKYFRSQAPGDVRFVDKNEDGVIDDEDKVMIGNPNPDFIFGFQLSADYKGFYLSATATALTGHQIAKSYRSFADSPKQNYTQFDYDNRWHGEGTSTKYPRLMSGPHRNSQNVSDIMIEDADFLKISNLTIGYSLKSLLTKMPISDLKIYVSVKNLVTFTKYSGMDPEVAYAPNDYEWASGIDLGLYPSSRTFLVGLNINF